MYHSAYEAGTPLPAHSMYYDMVTGESYDYKANENCILDDSGLDQGPLMHYADALGHQGT